MTEIALTPLAPDDAATFWPWLHEHLTWHLTHWADATHLGWDAADVDARIRSGRLVEQEWSALLSTASDSDGFVRVARRDGHALGAISCELRRDRVLGVPIGVLSWLHIDAAHRGQGLSGPLIGAGHDWFAFRGVAMAEVMVTAANEAAVRAYAARGYDVIDHRMLIGVRRG